MKKRKINYQESEPVTHFKMYKDGKNWVTSGISKFLMWTHFSNKTDISTQLEGNHHVEDTVIKGLAAVSALLGGSVVVTQDVSADTNNTATEKSVDNTGTVADKDVVTIQGSATSEVRTDIVNSESVSASELASSSESFSMSESASTSESNSISGQNNSASASVSESISTSELLSASGLNGSELSSISGTDNGSESVSRSESISARDTNLSSMSESTTSFSSNSGLTSTDSDTSATDTTKSLITTYAAETTKSSFSVDDPQYPSDMPRNSDNANKYDFEWLTVYSGSTKVGDISISIDRNGSGQLYIQEIKSNGATSTITLDQGDQGITSSFTGIKYYYDGISGNYSLVVKSTGSYSMHNSYVNFVAANNNYGTITNFVPKNVTQTTSYVDENGQPISNVKDVTQQGWTGQTYTTSSGQVINGYYSDDVNNNGSGTMSQFGTIGAQYEKNYHDGTSVVYTQTSEDGTMQAIVYNNGVQAASYTLAPGQTAVYNGRYYITNPYIQQTKDIQYQYKKLGNLIVQDEDGTILDETQYVNDATDATKAYYPTNTLPDKPGYIITAKDSNGNTVDINAIKNGTMPNNLSVDTIVTYEKDPASMSTSESVSTSESISGSESVSTSESISGSESVSTSESESGSESVSTSESISGSESISTSESISGSESVSTSESVSGSESVSTSESESGSESVSTSESESGSESVSTSESISGSESVSTSESISGSESVSTSESISGSESVSTSESISGSESVSTSESISGSESISTSESISGSESVSTSESESGSESVSTSESV
ncbi:KxYKxGKxW signal peptide domain-containing protein, partial [Leuconostoc suionicum]